MEEITEVIQVANILLEEKSEAIEVGLEIVAQEMGNILQELRDNIVRLTARDDLTSYDKPDVVHYKPNGKKESPTADSCNTSSNVASTSQNRSITIRSAPEGGKGKQRDKTQKGIVPSTHSEPVNNVKERKKISNKTSGNILLNPSASPNVWIKAMKYRVDQAIKERKVFTVCGNFYSVRHALVKRGWIEKVHLTFNTYDKDKLRALMEKDIPELMESARNPINGYQYKRVIFSKMLGSHQPDFFWENNNESVSVIDDNIKITVVNRFRPDTFSYGSKQSLCEAANQSHWYHNPGISHLLHPRSYNLANTTDPHNFLTDFKITAAVSLLKWVVKVGAKGLVISKEGKVSLAVFHFAMEEVQKCLQRCKHDDIDFAIEEAMDCQWNAFLEQFYKIVHMKHHFKETKGVTLAKLIKQAKEVLGEIKKYWPNMQMDGCLNLWILKPTNGTQGLGIYMCRTLQYILKIIRSNVTKKYIAQKYIERPLLIYHTKFDIRQWFLVHYGPPLTIWIYKECYVRFSSQIYNLRRLHESIHLTNNSVQVRYKNGVRDAKLPSHNMWDSHQFKKHLSFTGHPKVFDEVVYPGMKQAIVAAVMICRGTAKPRRGSFEICGSDFMLSETYEPWLLEINRKPALYRSTPVTARMCPQVLEDVIKVVVDRARNPNVTTGCFELAYTEKHQSLPLGDHNMTLEGKPLPPEYFYSTDQSVHSTDNTSGSESVPKGGLKSVADQMQSTLQNLLGVIRNEREKRQPDTEPPVSPVSSTSSMYTARDSDSDSRNSTELILDSNMEAAVPLDKSEKTILLDHIKNAFENMSFLGDGIGQT